MNANMISLGIMGCLSLSAAMAATPPHIILIMTDQHRNLTELGSACERRNTLYERIFQLPEQYTGKGLPADRTVAVAHRIAGIWKCACKLSV